MDFQGKPKQTKRIADQNGAEYKLNKHGEIVMNDDNDANRRTVEQCYRTRKTIVNPIVDWTDQDVWDFIKAYDLPYCSLYDEGFTRIGCIGCPLSGKKNMERDFERWPKYKELYIRAFQRMIDNHPGQIKILDPDSDTKFKLEISGGGSNGSRTGSSSHDVPEHGSAGRLVDGALNMENSTGGGMVSMVDHLQLKSSDSSPKTATLSTPPRKICRSNVQTMGESCTVLTKIRESRPNTSSPIGWKWARREDAEWMHSQWVKDEENGTIWGLNNQMMKKFG